eukprot:2293659-Amphidinium_carterae.1
MAIFGKSFGLHTDAPAPESNITSTPYCPSVVTSATLLRSSTMIGFTSVVTVALCLLSTSTSSSTTRVSGRRSRLTSSSVS